MRRCALDKGDRMARAVMNVLRRRHVNVRELRKYRPDCGCGMCIEIRVALYGNGNAIECTRDIPRPRRVPLNPAQGLVSELHIDADLVQQIFTPSPDYNYITTTIGTSA